MRLIYQQFSQSKYKLKDICNVDELVPPTKHFQISLLHKGERCSGGKHSKVRLPRLATGKAMGEKLAMFVIGKFTKPRCFSGIKSLPCHYYAQKHSWMDGNLFTEWVKELHRKIAIIIAN